MKIYIPILIFLLVSCVSNGDAQKKENTDIKDTLHVKIEHDEGLINDLSLLNIRKYNFIKHILIEVFSELSIQESKEYKNCATRSANVGNTSARSDSVRQCNSRNFILCKM